MKVFLTGASGWVGSATLSALVKAGHEVTALARSDQAAAKVKANGASDALKGSIEDLDVLKQGARDADAVIHLAYIHDFSDPVGSLEKDLKAIEAIASVLEGTNKIIITTVNTASAKPGRLASELDGDEHLNTDNPRTRSELFVRSLSKKGIRSAVVRLPPTVHGKGDWAFIPIHMAEANKKGYVAYVGDGKQRWSAVHVLDAAQLYVRALEKGATDGPVYHATAEGAVEFGEIATTIAKKLSLPTFRKTPQELQQALGFAGLVASLDMPVSSEWTRKTLGWQPTQVGLLEDIERNY